MENILEINGNFDFNSLYLENPVPMQGGSFFTKINYSDKKLPLYIQLPKCKSKNGIVKSSTTKKSYIDLLFNFNEEGFLSWFENLETRCRNLIFSKKDHWFQSDMDLDDIENMFLTPVKSYKSGKFICLRSSIPHTKNIKKDYCMIYDETEKILNAEDVTENKEIIPLILVDGIRFTSKTFQLEINLPQLMVLNIDNNIQNNCMIKSIKSNQTVNNKQNLDKEENLDKQENIGKQENIVKEENINKNIEENKITLEKNENIKDVKEVSKLIKDDMKAMKLDSKMIKEDSKMMKEDSKVMKKDNNNVLEEVDLDFSNNGEEFSLKNPAEVYTEIYQNAKIKAEQLKSAAIKAFLEAKQIKDRYNLEDSDISDEEILNNN